MNELSTVTGGAGFIGGHLVARLVELGRPVRVIERPGVDVGRLPAGVEVVFADIRQRQGLDEALAGSRFVYHLAANPNLWVRDRREFEAVNHLGAVHVFEAALAAGAERVVHTSTESILTKARSTGPIDENVEIDESDAVGPYCLSKLRAEKAAMRLANQGRPVIVVNPTMPVGPGDRGLSPPTRLILDFCSGKLPAVIDCTLNLIDVRDVAEGLIRAMAVGRPGRRYLLGGANLSLVGLLEILSESTGVPVPRWRVPYAFGLAFAYLNEGWADLVTGTSPKASVTGLRLARRIMHFDARTSLNELGLTPRPIRESLDDAVQGLRSDGRLPSIDPKTLGLD
ncbi:MAG: NAD-dependent epimerase/dehydratase family protein [Paludisphaera borealis]|uniref:NAD-dependent epimerase/dehydratase family protein n=1 Tax=Paludisphaera borealis TaxID=1387353 RepID=UPI002848EDF5|nr:NAD-dependent epimerase/dehydratase family protein [Paludisphaera borealis]MDR3620345.1 NAD-dependent epimerase/dehydratase family protein [Paludisphaera borealis]